MLSERRAHQRRAYPRVDVLADYNGMILVDVASACLSTTGLLVNLSEAGLGVQFAVPIPDVPRMEVDFSLGERRVRATCDVIWSTAGTRGLRFQDLPQDARAEIRCWLWGLQSPDKLTSQVAIAGPCESAAPEARDAPAIREQTAESLLAEILDSGAPAEPDDSGSTVADVLNPSASDDQKSRDSEESRIGESLETARLNPPIIEQSNPVHRSSPSHAKPGQPERAVPMLGRQEDKRLQRSTSTAPLARPSESAASAARGAAPIWEQTAESLLAGIGDSGALAESDDAGSSVADVLSPSASDDQKSRDSEESRIGECLETARLNPAIIEQSNPVRRSSPSQAKPGQPQPAAPMLGRQEDERLQRSTSTAPLARPSAPIREQTAKSLLAGIGDSDALGESDGSASLVADVLGPSASDDQKPRNSDEFRTGESLGTAGWNIPSFEQSNPGYRNSPAHAKPGQPEWAVRMLVRQEDERLQRHRAWRHRAYGKLSDDASQATPVGSSNHSVESLAAQIQQSTIQERHSPLRLRVPGRIWWIALAVVVATGVVVLVWPPLQREIMGALAPTDMASSAQASTTTRHLDGGSTTAVEVLEGEPLLRYSVPSSPSPAITRGNPVRRELPSYPANRFTLGMEGEVHAMLTISPAGVVEDVRILSGDAALAGQVRKTLSHWRYTPYTVNSAAVGVKLPVAVRFRIAASPGAPTPNRAQPSVN